MSYNQNGIYRIQLGVLRVTLKKFSERKDVFEKHHIKFETAYKLYDETLIKALYKFKSVTKKNI